MKKLTRLKSKYLLLTTFLGLTITLGGFWDFSKNSKDISTLNFIQGGVTTCWGRINQTFTAVMIKDIQSAYLNRGFLGISDECLNEVVSSGNNLKSYLGKDFVLLSQLLSDVSWFHEDVLKIHGPMISGGAPVATEKLQERYVNLENLKLKILDNIEMVKLKLEKISSNDQVIMGSGLLLVLFSLTIFGLKEYEVILRKKSIEASALNLLSRGQSKWGALVDALIIEALRMNDLKVTGQIFKDYHESILEIMATKSHSKLKSEELKQEEVRSKIEVLQVQEETNIQTDEVDNSNNMSSKISLKEVLVSMRNLHSEDKIQFSDFRDTLVAIDSETCEQIFNSIINKLDERKDGKRKIIISNQIHSDKVVINFYLSGSYFNSAELEFIDKRDSSLMIDDMNLMILKELTSEISAGLFIENKSDKNGKLSGMSVKLTLKKIPKDKAKLVSFVRGKKKDLTRQLVASQNEL